MYKIFILHVEENGKRTNLIHVMCHVFQCIQSFSYNIQTLILYEVQLILHVRFYTVYRLHGEKYNPITSTHTYLFQMFAQSHYCYNLYPPSMPSTWKKKKPKKKNISKNKVQNQKIKKSNRILHNSFEKNVISH